jgi:hypothetical protein
MSNSAFIYINIYDNIKRKQEKIKRKIEREREREREREIICEHFVFFIKTIKYKSREDEKKIRYRERKTI